MHRAQVDFKQGRRKDAPQPCKAAWREETPLLHGRQVPHCCTGTWFLKAVRSMTCFGYLCSMRSNCGLVLRRMSPFSWCISAPHCWLLVSSLSCRFLEREDGSLLQEDACGLSKMLGRVPWGCKLGHIVWRQWTLVCY